MKTLYFGSYDGSNRAIFDTKEAADEWRIDTGALAYITSIEYDDARNIIAVDGQPFDDFVENISDEKGSEEFERVRNNLLKDWEYKEFLGCKNLKTVIETRVRIWDVAYVIEDKESHLIVTIPCEKSDGLGNTTLGSYKRKITNPFEMAMLRKMAVKGVDYLRSHDEITWASLVEVANGYFTNKGWKVEDFK